MAELLAAGRNAITPNRIPFILHTFEFVFVFLQMPRDVLRVGPVVVLLNFPITDMITPFVV